MKKFLLPFCFWAASLSISSYAMESSFNNFSTENGQKGLGDSTLRPLDFLELQEPKSATPNDESYFYEKYPPVAKHIFSEMGLNGENFTIHQGSTGLTAAAINSKRPTKSRGFFETFI